jgi:hypothetical protein
VILPKPRPSFEEWSKDCAAVAKEILGLSDTLDPEDPYELRDLMRDAYDRRESPRALIEGAFEEDLARADYDEQLAAEALEHEEE